MNRYAWIGICVAVIAGALTCVKQGAFRCVENEDCSFNGQLGRCELIGFCSFPDPSCESGQRFGEQSGDQAGLCVTGDIAPELISVGGTVVGLEGSGLVVRNNGADDLAIENSGTFTFSTKVLTGDPYEVTVGSQPTSPAQTCNVTSGSGVAGVTNVADVTVSCTTATFKIGGTVVGLTGSGLVLTNNGADDHAVSASGPFEFATPIASASSFAVAIKTQPSGQTCNVSGATGVVGGADVSSVVVNCTPGTFTVGGTITGLEGTVVLQNGGDVQTVTSTGSFAFAVPLGTGSNYSVSVQTQPGFPPRSQTCSVANGSGTVGTVNVTTVSITCATNTFSIGGTITGLSGSITLRNNGEDLVRNASGAFTFPTEVASGNTYAVTIVTQPATQTCTITANTGTAGDADITSVDVDCGAASGDPGILCGTFYCDPAAGERCCVMSGVPTCTQSCNGGGNVSIRCDDKDDCIAQGLPALVCCGATNGELVNAVFCGKADLCESPDAYFCDPNDANPCPDGGTCEPTDIPFPGYHRCF